MNETLLWLDDIREPKDFIDVEKYNVIWVHSYKEFVDFFKEEKYMPDIIWFDHDLGENESGYHCAQFLIDWCEITKIPLCQKYYSQSQNPVGKENILKLLYNYEKFKRSEKDC